MDIFLQNVREWVHSIGLEPLLPIVRSETENNKNYYVLHSSLCMKRIKENQFITMPKPIVAGEYNGNVLCIHDKYYLHIEYHEKYGYHFYVPFFWNETTYQYNIMEESYYKDFIDPLNQV